MFYHALPKHGAIRKTGRWALRMIRPHRDSRAVTAIDERNLWQEGFCAWNAERLGISMEESVRRYRRSWDVLPGGHGGEAFRRFCMTQVELFSVIADDSPEEVYQSYQLHSWLFLLRQISQPVPVWNDGHPVVEALKKTARATIIDYGCGMAQSSITLALALRAKGVAPRLVLADIPTVRLEFVAWLCRRHEIPCDVLECTRERPLPDFPPADVVVATEIFEHLHDPLSAFERLNAALRRGGFILTNVDDHEQEFMHVSPNLQLLRKRMAERGFGEVQRYTLYRKSEDARVEVPAGA